MNYTLSLPHRVPLREQEPLPKFPTPYCISATSKEGTITESSTTCTVESSQFKGLDVDEMAQGMTTYFSDVRDWILKG